MTNILNRIEEEYTLSRNTFQEWREKKTDQFKSIFDYTKGNDKVSTNMFAGLHKTFIAISYTDSLSVDFEPIGFEDEEVADNFSVIAKFESKRMRLDILNYFKQSDRAIYNVSVRLLEWNKKENKPESYRMDPLSWYADPTPTGISGEDYRFHGFETEISLDDLKAKGYNTDGLSLPTDKENIDTQKMEYLGQNKQADDTENKMVGLYTHFYQKDGIWYKVVCDTNFSKVLEKVKVGKKCPIILNFYTPRVGSATGGESILDIAEDKERAGNILFNLMLIKAKREGLGGDFIYDMDVIQDPDRLAKPTVKKRYLRAKLQGGKRLSDALMELPQSQIKQDVELLRQTLKTETQHSVGIDSVIQGIRGDKSITATESQTIQQNANLNLALNNKIDSMGEKDFWDYIFYMYQENFDDSKKVVARVSVGFGSKSVTLEKKDFLTKNSLDVIISNKSDIQAKEEAEKLNIPYYQQEANNPENPKITRLFFKRKIAKLSGMTPDEIKMVYYDVFEEKAKQQVLLLNQNILPENIDSQQDQFTFLMIYRRAQDTDATQEATKKRMYILETQKLQEANNDIGGMDKALNNQMMANSQAQQRVAGESLNNIPNQ